MSNWPDSVEFWKDRRACVTGGAGFLGSHLVEAMKKRGVSKIFVVRSKDYDLRDPTSIRSLLKDVSPDIVVHLAGRVGGIGDTRAHPAEFFYDNLIMGVPLLHEAWRAKVEKFVALGTVCAYPKFTSV